MKKYLTEFISTFFLVSTIGHVVIHDSEGIIPPLAIGAILTALVYAGRHISGAHYNPAVTLAVWMRGKCDAKDVPGYIAAQLSAAFLAAFIVLFMKGEATVDSLDFTSSLAIPLLAEFFGTFILVFVILEVATSKKQKAIPTTAWPSALR